MSALDGWIDVCRTGVWRDAHNRRVDVTDAMLDGVVAAYGGQDPAPAVVGHPETDAPAYAWVDGLRKVGDRLQAKFRDIQPAFRQAVEAGSYTGRSVKIVGGQLRHVGWLGGRAPAVPGLAPTQFADAGAGDTVCFAEADLMAGDMRYGFHAMARIARGMRERIIAADGIEAADEAIPSWEIDALQRAADEAQDAAAFAAPPEGTQEGTDTDMDIEKLRKALSLPATATEEQILAAAETATAGATGLAAREAALAAREADAAQSARLAAANTALDVHVTAGRVLPAERASLAALLASLPEGDEAVIAFAAPEGDGEVREQPRAILERFLGALPKRVPYGELAGGDVPAGGDAENEAIAAEARVLMSEAAERGETLSAVEAVDQVRAKRGLNSGGTG